MDVRSTEPELRSLMVAGLDGDAASHRSLLERLSRQLRAYFKGHLIRINRGPVEAEDLVQEALLAIHTRRHTYDRSQPFTPWVYAIARYKFLDYLRRTKASTSEVPPKARQAIQYVKLDGLSVREAAAKSGMSEAAVKVSVHRGLKALATFVNKERRS